jgi:hypothetical protein
MVSLYLIASTATPKRPGYQTLPDDEEHRPMTLRLSLVPVIISFLAGCGCVALLNLGKYFAAHPKIFAPIIVSHLLAAALPHLPAPFPTYPAISLST